MAFPNHPLFAPNRTSRDEVVAFQEAQLRKVVAHAYEHVPYYRRLFDEHGVKPGDVDTPADLPLLPISERRTLQELPLAERLAHGVDPASLSRHRTSGSSGEPLTIMRTQEEGAALRSVLLRLATDFGMRLMDTTASIEWVDHRAQDAPASPEEGLYPTVPVDCLLPPRQILEAVIQARPQVVSGFPGVLAQVAQAATPELSERLRPRFFLLGGELLTPDMRALIETTFQAPVYETYASHEFNYMAWQCKETGAYHVSDDSVVLEILKDGRAAEPGERGEVVATALHSFAMPFVRYRLGDLVTRGPGTCSCGAPFSTIERVLGRMIDHFVLPGGGLMHPYELIVALVQERPWIRQYRLVQTRIDGMELKVVPLGEASPEQMDSLKERLRGVLGPDIELAVDLVPEIAQEPSGKFRVVESRVRSFYDGASESPDDAQAPGTP